MEKGKLVKDSQISVIKKFLSKNILYGLRLSVLNKVLLGIILISIACQFIIHVKNSDSWSNLLEDAKIAIDIEKNWQWKHGGVEWYPERNDGSRVSGTTYERVAYAKAGLILLSENLLGYGLVERSFKYLSKKKWPNSKGLSQTHSGWLDLALGIGLPGILLIFFSSLICLRNLMHNSDNCRMNYKNFVIVNQFRSIFYYLLIAVVLIWFTSELSQKVYFDFMIFVLAMGVGASLVIASNEFKS